MTQATSQDDGVIIDGQPIDLPLNLNTIADHLSLGAVDLDVGYCGLQAALKALSGRAKE